MENKIILIEDDEEIRGMITDYLSGEFEVLSFNDGTTAIRTNTSYDEYSLALIVAWSLSRQSDRSAIFLSSSLLQKIMILINH